MKKIFFFCFALLLFSCGKNHKFTVEGNVTGAKGSVLYFEHVGISKAAILDSVVLKEKGGFKFEREQPASPDFYRLRLVNHIINLSVDSTETIKIQADSSSFAYKYSVEGSENCLKIKELSDLKRETAVSIKNLDKEFADKKIDQDTYLTLAQETVNNYKSVARKYIIDNPGSPVAYFALLQTIDNLMFFNPYNKEDNRLYGAVATQWDFYHPESEFSKHIKRLGLMGMKVLRGDRPIEYHAETVDILDFSLPDMNGKNIKLSDYVKGKVTLMEFTSYQAKGSPEHNMLLANVYEKLKDRGFQIYQISLDTDEHVWKNIAFNLPWTCVRDPQSVYSDLVRLYNVRNLPASFIINRNGEIVMRVESYDKLDASITKYL